MPQQILNRIKPDVSLIKQTIRIVMKTNYNGKLLNWKLLPKLDYIWIESITQREEDLNPSS